MDPMEEVKVLQLCRQKLGDDFGLRIDPNGVWSVATAIKAGHRMEELELQYFEDPSWGHRRYEGWFQGTGSVFLWQLICIRII